MSTREFFVRTAQVFCIGTVTALASTALVPTASAATHHVPCGQAHLRDAIIRANSTPGGNTLNLTRNCTYRLTAALPSITSPITIHGNNATITRKSGTFRILTVDGGNLTLRATTLANGVTAGSGGGIVVTGNGTLAVVSSVIRNNHADFGGGIGVFSGSQAHVSGSVIRDNTATRNGGGIVNDGALTVNNSKIDRNTAGGAGGGIASIGTLTATRTDLLRNTAQTGGGLANGVPEAPGGTATLSRSNIRNNHAADNNPGGIYNNQGTVTLQATVVANNTPNNCLTSPTPVPGCSN